MAVEMRQISEQGEKQKITRARKGTVVLPLGRRKRLHPLRAVAFFLLLVFFAVCVFTVGQRIGYEATSKEGRLGEYLIEQGTSGVTSARQK